MKPNFHATWCFAWWHHVLAVLAMAGRLDLPTFLVKLPHHVDMVMPMSTIDTCLIAYPWIHYNGRKSHVFHMKDDVV